MGMLDIFGTLLIIGGIFLGAWLGVRAAAKSHEKRWDKMMAKQRKGVRRG